MRSAPLAELLGLVGLVLCATPGCTGSSDAKPPIADGRSTGSVHGALLRDVASERGIVFRHTYGSVLPLPITETMGSGVAFFDYDSDGDQDLLFVNAGQDFNLARQVPGSALYRNDGGTFTDVTAGSGLAIDTYATGCCIGDYDDDGKDDLFVTGYGRNQLFRNLGAGKFEETTRAAGIPSRKGAWGMGCAFLDVDRDGKLDLYVANYVIYDPKIPLCETNGVKHGCTPNEYKTQRNELYMNLGGGRFVDRAGELGAADITGAGLGVVVSDFDNDGWQDLFIANDGTPNALLRNVKGRFVNVAQKAGVAYSEDGSMRAGMGTHAADVTGDGLPELIITNFQHEPNSLYRNEGNFGFVEISYPSGIGSPSLNKLAFGVAFADLDGNGWTDLYVGNGHVYDNVHQFDDTATFEQTDQVFLNEGDGRFKEAAEAFGKARAVASVARGVAVGDANDDGAADVATNNLGRPARLLENRGPGTRAWYGLRLLNRKGATALGARVTLKHGGRQQTREVQSGGSYLSQHDTRALFSLQSSAKPEEIEIEVRWPDGSKQNHKPTALGSYETVRWK